VENLNSEQISRCSIEDFLVINISVFYGSVMAHRIKGRRREKGIKVFAKKVWESRLAWGVVLFLLTSTLPCLPCMKKQRLKLLTLPFNFLLCKL